MMENNERFSLVIKGKRIETIEELRADINYKAVLRYYKSGLKIGDTVRRQEK
jgi:hypothetical protein